MKFILKILIILLFMLFIEYDNSYADINVINKALNKNTISTSEIHLDQNPSAVKADFKKNSNIIQPPPSQNFYKNSPTIYKNLKIKVNGKEQIIHVPFLNEKFLKKQKFKPIPKRIKEKKIFPSKLAPIRIGEDDADITLMPCPFEYFSFPSDEADELKIQAIADVKSIFDKVNSMTWENYGQTMQEIYKLTYEKIFPRYNKYPDICMITRLYLTESSFKMSPQYYSSGTYLAQAYDQIITDYNYLAETNVNVKKVIEVINQRKLQMKENNKRLESEVQSQLSYIENYKQNIENALKIIHPNNDQKEIDQHVKSIAEQYSGMAIAYNLIYNNYMLMGDENKAHEIFNFVLKPDGGTEIKGKLFEIYNQIPYEVPFKFKTNNGESQISVKQYKNAEDILYIMKTFCQLETQNVKNQDFTENTNNFEDKVINHMCKFVEDFQPNESGIPPTAENPKGKAKELIDNAKLQEYHTYAYGWNAYPGTETYYKNKPAITKLYFSRIENVELTSEDIPKPTERITLRADVNYNMPAPLYDFKIEIKSFISGRTKTVIMKKSQYGSSAYYAHFNPNETNDPKDKIKNLINNAKDEKEISGTISSGKVSICCYDMEEFETKEKKLPQYDVTYFFDPHLYGIYNTNEFFLNNKDDSQKIQKTLGYATWADREYNKKNIYEELKNDINQSDDLKDSIDKLYYAKNILKTPSSSFIKSAGFENIYAIYKTDANSENKKYAYAAIRNQADVFIIDCHGWETMEYNGIKANGGLIECDLDQEGNPDKSKVLVAVPVYDLIKENGVSEYSENLDVLILSSCATLRWKGNWKSSDKNDWIFAHGWYKVLPNGVILGYHEDPTTIMSLRAIEEMGKYFAGCKNKLTYNEIANKWMTIHEELYNKYLADSVNNPYRTAKFVCYISNNTYNPPAFKSNGRRGFAFVPQNIKFQ